MAVFVGVGVGGRRAVSKPPAPTAGQTLVWRANFTGVDTAINPGAPANFTSVAGTDCYPYPVGPRFGTSAADPAWRAPGRSLRIPNRTDAGAGGTVFDSYYDLTADAIPRGMMCGWFKVASAPTSYCRFFLARGYSLDVTAPLTAIVVKSTTFGLPGLTFKHWDSNTGGDGTSGTALTSANLHHWVYFQIAWEYNGTSTVCKTFYKLLGDTSLTPMGTRTDATATSIAPRRVFIHCINPDLAGVDPPAMAVGALSLYRTTTFAEAQLEPADIAPPVEQTYDWYADPAGSGVDGGYGSAARGVPNWATVLTLRKRGAYLGSHRGWANTSDNVQRTAASVTNKATGDALLDDILSGTVTCRGHRINFTGGTMLVPPGSTQLPLENITGARVNVAAGSMPSARLDLSAVSWTQPDAGGNPNVWKYTAANLATACIEEDGYLGIPQNAANEAAALPLVNGTPLACWADSTGILLRTRSGGNPNSDGLARSCGVPFAYAGTGPGLIAIRDGEIDGTGTIDVGPMAHYSGGAPAAQYAWSSATGGVSVARNILTVGGTKHIAGQVGNDLTGVCIRDNLRYSRGCVANGTGNFTADVGFTGSSSATLGTIYNAWAGCTTVAGESSHMPGARPSDVFGVTFLTAHTSGKPSNAFVGFVIRDSYFFGLVTNAQCATGSVDYDDSTFAQLAFDSAGATVDDCTLLSPRITCYAGTGVTFTGCDVSDTSGGTVWGDAVLVTGTVAFVGGTFDVSGYNFGGSGAAVWKDGGTFTLTFTGTTLTGTGSNLTLVKDAEVASDTILLTDCAFVGGDSQPLLGNYNDGATTSNRTITQARALGLVTP